MWGCEGVIRWSKLGIRGTRGTSILVTKPRFGFQFVAVLQPRIGFVIWQTMPPTWSIDLQWLTLPLNTTQKVSLKTECCLTRVMLMNSHVSSLECPSQTKKQHHQKDTSVKSCHGIISKRLMSSLHYTCFETLVGSWLSFFLAVITFHGHGVGEWMYEQRRRSFV